MSGDTQPDEAAWLAQIALGDPQALRALYDAYRPRLRRYLWRLLAGDAAAVEDCLQETFITVWRAAATFRGEGRVAAWLFRIASRNAAHARRHSASHPTEQLPDDGASDPRFEDLTPEAAILDRLSLGDALGQLSLKHRVTLELVFVYGFTVEEAAQILGIPAGTVKSRLSYARRALAQALVGEES